MIATLYQAIAPVSALWRREVIKFLRDRSRLLGAIVQPLGLWLLLGLGFQQTFQMPGDAVAGINYLEFLFPGIIALMILFTAIFSTISVVEERKSGFLQAAVAAPMSRTVLVLGNALGGTTLAVFQAALFLILLPVIGFSVSVQGLLLVLLASILMGLAFTALGFAIAWRMDTTRGFHAVMNLFLLPLWFLSGALFPAEGASPALAWLIHLNPVSYGVDLMRQGLYMPADAPLHLASIGVGLLISTVLAAVLIAWAVYTVRRPLFSDT